MTTPHKWKNEIIAWANGKKLEWRFCGLLDPTEWAIWDEFGAPCFNSVAHEFRIHDPYRELKEAKALGHTIQHNDCRIGWTDCRHPNWTDSVECYRIKPREPLVVWIPEFIKGGNGDLFYEEPLTGSSNVRRWIKMVEAQK